MWALCRFPFPFPLWGLWGVCGVCGVVEGGGKRGRGGEGGRKTVLIFGGSVGSGKQVGNIHRTRVAPGLGDL